MEKPAAKDGPPTRLFDSRCANVVNAHVCTIELFLFRQPQAGDRINNTIDDQTADKADTDTGHRADDLGHQADAAQATQSLPQVVLEVEGDAIYAIGVTGLVYGYRDNLDGGTPVAG